MCWCVSLSVYFDALSSTSAGQRSRVSGHTAHSQGLTRAVNIAGLRTVSVKRVSIALEMICTGRKDVLAMSNSNSIFGSGRR